MGHVKPTAKGVEKASGTSLRAERSARGKAPLSLATDPVVEGTSGAVDWELFRESLQEAALQGCPCICGGDPASSSCVSRGRHTDDRFKQPLPGWAKHGLATGGVRVEQVGVKPLQRSVVVVVAEGPDGTDSTWPEKARLAIPSRGRYRTGAVRRHRAGLVGTNDVLVDH